MTLGLHLCSDSDQTGVDLLPSSGILYARFMNAPFNEERLENWNAIHDRATNSPIKYVFRGHAVADWPLSSSFVRECKRIAGTDDDYWLSVEYRMLRDFKRRAHLYEKDLPATDDHVSWLALMQHYGAPTRLLDFTYSLYVACFFALMAADGDAAVWAIDDSWLRSNIEFPSADGLREDELRAQCTEANQFLSTAYRGNRGGGNQYNNIPHGIFMIEPERQTERLAIQQGLFLMQKNIHSDFLTNLIAKNIPSESAVDELQINAPSSSHITKFVLGEQVRVHGLHALHTMNVTAESLFPGIDGYSKAIMHGVLGR